MTTKNTPSSTAAPVASTASDPNVVPWKRRYVPDAPLDEGPQGIAMVGACYQDIDQGVKENDSTGPKIAVLGDSAVDLIRPVALEDKLYHWAFASHCGEKFSTVISKGRLKDALAINPDVLVINLGSNNTSESWQLRPDMVQPGIRDLKELLDLTDGVKCRVVVDLPSIPHPKDTAEDGKLRVQLTDQINNALHEAGSRPGVRVAKWSEKVNANRGYIFDHAHPTPAGINAMINTIIETAQPCIAGPPPGGLQVVSDGDVDTVSWNEVSGQAGTSYFVEASDGRSATTPDTALNFPHRQPESRVEYRVTSRAGGAPSAPSSWTAAGPPVGMDDKLKTGLIGLLLVLGYGAMIAVAADFVRVVEQQKTTWLLVHHTGAAATCVGWLLLGNLTMIALTVAWLLGSTVWFVRSRSRTSPPEADTTTSPEVGASKPRENQLA